MSYQRPTRQYTNQFKKESVELFLSGEKKLHLVAENLGLPTSTLRQWVNKHTKDIKSFTGTSNLTLEEAELSRLRKELADVKMERDILKKAVAIFSVPGK